MKKILSLLLTLAMVLSWLPSAALATKNTEFPPGPDAASLEEQMQRALFSADLRQYSEDDGKPERYDPDETIRVIVEMKAAPAYEVASTASTDALQSAETAALKGQEATIQAVRRQLGLEPVHRTACLVNMVTYNIRRGDVKKLEELPGVVSVTEAVQYEVEMYTSKDMANVLEAWGMGETGYTGKGMTIAIIDTGVNYLHKDMVQNPDTMKHTQAQMQEMIEDLGHGKWYSDKVPFGYSYISGNDNILNPKIHGYHVAGISAANGDEEDGGIAGVAPDAQIFAMQVYDANSDLGGLSDDIICAIEDAVKLGADVINLSLGTDSGFYENDRYIQAAVNAARDKGSFVSVAAGNAGTSSTCSLGLTGIWNNWNRKDTALVGDPATADGAVAVASVNSRSALANSFSVTIDGGEPKNMACVKLENADFLIDPAVALYDAGDGAQDKYLDENRKPLPGVEGTVAIAAFNPEWDSTSQLFAVLNPSDAGCAGVIFYNSDPNSGDTLTDLSYSPNFTEAPIPYAYVSYTDGQTLLAAARAKKTASFGGYGGYVFISTQRPDAASGFSSWGPTPSLELKPEMAAPGGNVYSLAGDDSYEFMSGTSMATPFVSGAAAAVKQYVQETGLEVGNVAEFIRKNLMNTAAPVMNAGQNNNLYSVRQVGAGLINVEAAVSNTVLATYGQHNRAAIELGDELGTTTTGTITLTNYGKEAVAYTPNNEFGVFTDYTDTEADDAYYDVPLVGASVTFDKDTVTVPAGGTATVTFTLTLPETPNGNWAEGYIGFTAQTEGVPSLSMPFMGFIGDWDEEPIIDAPEWEEGTVIPKIGYDLSNPLDYGYYGHIMHGTSLMSFAGDGEMEPLGAYYFEEKNTQYFGERLEPQTIAISPNGDNHYDVAIPWLGLLRNAYELKATILDTGGKVVVDLGTTTHLTKLQATTATAIPPVHGKALIAGGNYRGWDGTVYDQKTGTYVPAPEGDYIVRLQARVREDGDWQTVEMPLAVDLTKPVITELKAEDQGNGIIVISFRASDAHGLYPYATFCVNEDEAFSPVARLDYDKDTQVYSFKMEKPETPATDKGYHVTLMIADRAGNTAVDQLTIGASSAAGGAWSLFNLNPDSPVYTTGSIPMVYQVRGFAPAGSTVTFNGKEAVFDGTDFVADVLLTGPVSTIQVKLTGPGGDRLFEGQATVVIDNDTPRLGAFLPDGDIGFTACGDGYGLVLDKDLPAGTAIPLKARLYETSPVFMSYSDRIQQGVSEELQPDEDGYIHFQATLRNAPYGTDKSSSYVYAEFQLYTKDAAGYDSTLIGSVWTPTSVKAAAQAEGLTIAPKMAPVVDSMDAMDVVYGSMLQEDGTFRVSGYLYNQVDAVLVGDTVGVINEDLTWHCDISLTEGVNTLALRSRVGEETYSSGFLKIFYSEKGPVLELDLPEAIHGTYYVDEPEFTFTGRVKSLGDDLSLFVNDVQILNANNYGSADGKEIVREFTYPVTLIKGNNYFEFIMTDVSGLPLRTMVHLYYGEYVDLTVKSLTVRGVTASQNENTFSVKLPYDEKGLPTDASEIQIALNNPEASASSPITVDGGKTWTFTVSKGDASATYTIQVSMEPSTICTHEKTELKNVKEATCTEPGYTGDEVCTACGEILKKGQEIPALGHDFSVKGETVAPTETEEGYTVYQCSRCDATEHRDIVPATGHKCPSQAFADLDTTQWYHEYTDYVIGNGLMNGVGNNRFAPNGSTTRAMLVTTLYRLADSPEVGEGSTFTDVAEGAWYADAIAWAQDVGIAKGVTETRFAPNSNVTREQAATFLYRFVTEYLKAEPVKGADLSTYKDADQISNYAKEAVAWATAEGLFQGFEDGTMQPKGTLTRAQMAKLLTILDADA